MSYPPLASPPFGVDTHTGTDMDGDGGTPPTDRDTPPTPYEVTGNGCPDGVPKRLYIARRIVEEGSELMEAVAMDDLVGMVEEAGDVFLYLQNLVNRYGFHMADIEDINREKVELRHKHGKNKQMVKQMIIGRIWELRKEQLRDKGKPTT